MEPTTNNASAKIITALIIGLLVGFAAGVFWQARRSSSITPKGDTAASTLEDKSKSGTEVTIKDTESAPKTNTSLGTSLLVSDQSAGDRAEIANIDAKEILWVAVREEKNGELGNILGAQKVFTGSAQKVTVELLRPTVAGGTYRVVLYKDIGTPAFNYREDTLVEGVVGKFVAK